jgi:streptomycin 6-kinase
LRTAVTEFVLATDLHAGNILRAEREPWLVIDPKPFVGDPSYDVTQHLFNCQERLRAEPKGLIYRVADLAQLDHERVRLWAFARTAADPRSDWNSHLVEIARLIAP